jgi:hypothetical protein
MSARTRKPSPRKGPKHSDQARAHDQYDVGFGKPPRDHQFKPGQSGNRRGRPKGSKNSATILNELLQRKIEVREGGRLRKITIHEAVLRRILEDSLKGNIKSAAFLLNRLNSSPGDDVSPGISEDDQAVLDAFVQSLQPKPDGSHDVQ